MTSFENSGTPSSCLNSSMLYELNLELRNGVESELDLPALRTILVTFKRQGGTQEVAKQTLEQITQDYNGEAQIHDRLLEVMDLVDGWCRPALRVW